MRNRRPKPWEVDQTPAEKLSDPVPEIRAGQSRRQSAGNKALTVDAETACAGTEDRPPAAPAVGECLAVGRASTKAGGAVASPGGGRPKLNVETARARLGVATRRLRAAEGIPVPAHSTVSTRVSSSMALVTPVSRGPRLGGRLPSGAVSLPPMPRGARSRTVAFAAVHGWPGRPRECCTHY